MPRFKKFEVGPMVRLGKEPFHAIRPRVDALKPGEGRALVCPFLPAPLLEKLRREGFESRVERAGFSGGVVYCWRPET